MGIFRSFLHDMTQRRSSQSIPEQFPAIAQFVLQVNLSSANSPVARFSTRYPASTPAPSWCGTVKNWRLQFSLS